MLDKADGAIYDKGNTSRDRIRRRKRGGSRAGGARDESVRGNMR